MILNHFLTRRIGFDTVTAFKIHLKVKLNSIMPMYNKMFDMLEGWNLFNDGETVTRNVNDTRATGYKSSSNSRTINDTKNSLTNTSNTNTSNSVDRRSSDLPQSEIDNVQNASYLTNYSLEKNTGNTSDTSKSEGSSNSNNQTNSSENSNTDERGTLKEEIIRSPADKMTIYKEFLENSRSIYDMIFNDLNDLFYGIY